VPTGPIWGRWGRRLLTRVSIFVVVPLALGALFSFLILLRNQGRLQETWWGEVLPFAATASALTLLYWVVPNTRVRLSAAIAGSIPAAAAFDLLRRFFRLYLEAFPAMSLVYGGFALAILFMMSIQVSWLMVLLGAEIAYAVQHFPQIGGSDPEAAAPAPPSAHEPKPEAET
jgi:membrane protein